jgi:hypothetical protein
VQTAVDRDSHLIADFEVTSDCNDYNSLKKVAQQAKETLKVETIHASADKGYDDHKEIEACVLNGIIPHVGFQNDKEERLIVLEHKASEITEEERASTKPEGIRRCLEAGVLPKCYENTTISIETQENGKLSCFTRNEDDTVTCPTGCTLTRVHTGRDGSAQYQCQSAYRSCTNRCTESKRHKVVLFGPNTIHVPVLMCGGGEKAFTSYPPEEIPYNAFTRMQKRAKKTVVLHIRNDIPAQRERLCLSEHPFGTVKWYHGAHYLLCKGKKKATAELGLSFLTYNLRRAINMAGAERLIAAMQG